MNILYTIIIYPLVQVIEICYLFAYRVFGHNSTFAVCGVSVAVSVLTLPLYFIAEKYQQIERDTQKRLKTKIDKIKAVFTGDERFMLLSTYYRQNHYHPIYAMRSTLGLLIQIPFFIAAYSYLSNLEALKEAHFFSITNMGAPDNLAHIGAFSLNILPVIMTIINIAAGMIYTKGLAAKDKIQLYGMAIVFLVLLYNSPAGLVLYWTMNNIFSLLKNCLQKLKNARKIIFYALCVCAVFFDLYIICFNDGYWLKKTIVCIAFSSVFLLPVFRKAATQVKSRRNNHIGQDNKFITRCFVFSSVILFFLAGLIVPASLIVSSVQEFSFIESYTTPFPFILQTMTQAAGLFLFWPLCIFFLLPKKIQIWLSIGMLLLCGFALVNTFLIPENFGFLTVTLIFSEPRPYTSYYKIALLNIALLVLAAAFFLFFFFSKKRTFVLSIQLIILISLAGFGIVRIITIQSAFSQFQSIKQSDNKKPAPVQPVYTFSQTGKNVLLIMLDAGISGYVPYIFDEKPELLSAFTGFTWYPNCISFAGHTLAGAPPLYGGYEYSPKEINKRAAVPLAEKHKEAYLLLPRLFSDSGYQVTVTDPPFDNYSQSNISIFDEYPKIHAENLEGKYSANWLQEHPDAKGLFLVSSVLKTNLIRFSFFKMSPLFFRLFIYDDGEWLVTTQPDADSKIKGGLTASNIDDYALLDFLPRLTQMTGEAANTFSVVYGHLPHDDAFLRVPGYVPAQLIADKGNGPFAEESAYHVNMASFLLLGKWFEYLKDNGVYDTTRIIIVSDHGANLANTLSSNVNLPDGENLQKYNALLLVKDFDEYGDEKELSIDNTFMVNADVPLLALNSIITNPVNPFTGIPLRSDKTDGITITTIGALDSRKHSKYMYKINNSEWLHVHDNIFDPANWGKAEN
ncbi:membrane protein [Spirochaetia bacterium]|nr:membrane protein [Spirochaetia bacterium]